MIKLRTNKGFVQLGLDVAAINSSAYPGFGAGLINIANICSKYLSLSKAGQRLRAEGILIPHLQQYLSVGSA